jgi:hypothetical protein
MALSKIQSESINLADTFTFTGTVSGAGSEGLVHLETQNATSAVANIKFGPDVFNTTYDKYYVIGRALPATDNVNFQYRWLDNSEAQLTATDSYRYRLNNSASSNNTVGVLTGSVGSVHAVETGLQFFGDVWLRHDGTLDLQAMAHFYVNRVSTATDPTSVICTSQFRWDRDTTQPEGMMFYFSSGNIEKAQISVFGVSEG